MKTLPKLVASMNCAIGESPVWHDSLECVLFLDIPAGRVYRFDTLNCKCELFAQTRMTGGFTIQRDGSLLLFQDGRIAILELNGSIQEIASGLCPGNERFNDVIADPEGRVFAGTLGGNGKLLRFNLDGSITQICDGFGIPNGMGFTPDLKGMYFTDSVPRKIYHFDYDYRTGDLSNCRVFAEIPLHEGVPDGMAVDNQGYVWTAVWFGGRVKRFAPDGKLDREICFPASQTSALCFGGRNLGDIFVTTAGSNAGDSLIPPEYDFNAIRGGGLYRTSLDKVSGSPPFRSNLKLR